MLAYVIMFVVMFAIKCVTLTFVKNKESTVVSTFLSGTNQIFLNTIVWFSTTNSHVPVLSFGGGQ